MAHVSAEITASSPPIGSSIVGWALVAGATLGVVAKLLASMQSPLMLLGAGVAFWVSTGFLLAQVAARNRELLDGTVWASTTMAVYLGAWLLGYCLIFGLQQSSGFGAAWLDERLFFILAPWASVIIGGIAVISLRKDWIGDAFLAAPIAWSLPEVGYAFLQGWQFVALVAVPVIVVAAIPLATERHRSVNRVVFAGACLAGGAFGFLLMNAVDGRW